MYATPRLQVAAECVVNSWTPRGEVVRGVGGAWVPCARRPFLACPSPQTVSVTPDSTARPGLEQGCPLAPSGGISSGPRGLTLHTSYIYI